MKPWGERPPEVAHLFNPAFCALLLREAARGFAEESPSGMPHPLLFLLLPIVLHKATRESLPVSIATKMHPWLQEHQEARIGFSHRCAAILPHTREAILFAVNAQMVALSQDGSIQAPRLRLKQLSWPADSESAICRKRAHFLGRWLALAGDVATIFAMWGVRP